MSANTAIDIHALIAAGRVVEAGTLLAMHGEELPSDMRQELEQERQRLWQRASDLVNEGEALEQAGWTEEAWSTYQKAAKIACDFPGLQDTLKRMTEAVDLTRAVQHRSKRIRQNATRVVRTANTSRRRSPLVLAAVVILAIGAGLWFVKGPPKPTLSPPHNSAPMPTETVLPAAEPIAPIAPPSVEATPPQPIPSRPEPSAAPAVAPPPSAATTTPAPSATAAPMLEQPTVQPPPATTLYTVQAGDSLILIAERQLCHVEGWSGIYKKNRKLISHADKLTIGTQLDLSGLPNRCPQPR